MGKFLEMHFFGPNPLQASCKGVLNSLEQFQKKNLTLKCQAQKSPFFVC